MEGSLLIAHPALLDPNFRRSVIHISTHDADGSFGLIINRPAGRLVADLLPDHTLGALAKAPVFLGGPVGVDQLIFAAFIWRQEENRLECRHHVGLEEAEALVEDQAAIVRGFVGYAGWGKGQLDGELSQQAWLVKEPQREMLDVQQVPTLWRALTSSFGPWFRLVAEAPEDLTQN